MTGESPTRPAIFQAKPEVVVVPEISPFSFTARQLIVPQGGRVTTVSIHGRRACFSGVSSKAERCCCHSGLSVPGRQFRLVLAFQASQASRDFSVTRFISSKLWATAKRVAP